MLREVFGVFWYRTKTKPIFMITVDSVLVWFFCMDFPEGFLVGSPTLLALCLGTIKFHPLLVFRRCFSWLVKNLSFFGPRSDFWVLVGSTQFGKDIRKYGDIPPLLGDIPKIFLLSHLSCIVLEKSLMGAKKLQFLLDNSNQNSVLNFLLEICYLQFIEPFPRVFLVFFRVGSCMFQVRFSTFENFNILYGFQFV